LGPAPGGPNSSNQAGAAPLPTPNNPFGTPAPYRAASDATSAGHVAGGPAGSTATTPNRTEISGNAKPAPNASALVQTGPYGSTPSNPPAPSANNSTNLASGAATAADWRTAPSPGAQPANFQAPAGAAPLNPSEFSLRDPMPGSPQTMPGSADPRGTLANVPSAPLPRDDAAAPLTNPAARNPAGAAMSTSGASGTDEKFRAAEVRLRELGATHYMLETWGPDNNRYRFVCEMALGGGGMNRYFWAIEDDPWRAMDSVLRQVEQWRAQPKQ
jgi:hypothetical protein